MKNLVVSKYIDHSSARGNKFHYRHAIDRKVWRKKNGDTKLNIT